MNFSCMGMVSSVLFSSTCMHVGKTRINSASKLTVGLKFIQTNSKYTLSDVGGINPASGDDCCKYRLK